MVARRLSLWHDGGVGDEHSLKEPVVLLEEIFPGDTNAYGTAFGGKILALMDRAAGLVASRFAHRHFVTASLDDMHFSAPVKQGEIAEVEARLVYTSKHTYGVKVLVYAVDKTEWQRKPCGQGVFFMVATGPDGKPQAVKQLEPEGKKARRDWDEVEAVHKAMLGRRRSTAGN